MDTDIEEYIINSLSTYVYVSISYCCIVIIDYINNLHYFIDYTKNHIIINKDFDNPHTDEYDYMIIFMFLNYNFDIHYYNVRNTEPFFMERLIYNRDITIDDIL